MSETNPKNDQKSEWSALRRLSHEFKYFKAPLIASLAFGFLVSAVQPLSVRLSQTIVDNLNHGVDPHFFVRIPLLLVALFIASGIAKYCYSTLRRKTSERIVMRLRTYLYDKYLSIGLASLEKMKAGELISRLQNDLTQIHGGMETLSDLLKEPFTFLGLIAVAFYCDWQLTLMVLVVAPLVVQLFSQTGRAVKRYSSRNMAQFGELVSVTEETLQGSRVIRVFGLEKILRDKFAAIHQDYFKTTWKSIKVQELATPLVELVGALIMAGVLIYGGYRISEGHLTTGKLVAFVIAIGLSQMPIKQLNNAFLKLKAAEAAAERIFALLDIPEAPEPARPSSLTHFEREIEYKNVGLAYYEKMALENISFSVKKGECVALVGESGGGKSSLVNLLPRLYEPSCGQILIDGEDSRNIPLNFLRSLFSFVTQDVFLFNDTIYENIRFGKPNATREEIERAARLAHCNDFIQRSPEGFETRIGDRGLCLSGGERQRIAIARAFLRDAPILVLDEATSNLDSRSEEIVQKALEELMKGKTTFLIAHRFSTLRQASRILVLHQGRIVEEGTHEHLISNSGSYKNLYQRQVFS